MVDFLNTPALALNLKTKVARQSWYTIQPPPPASPRFREHPPTAARYRSMRYSKKDREQAILICAIAASTPGLACNYLKIADEGTAMDLALAAWKKCSQVHMSVHTSVHTSVFTRVLSWSELHLVDAEAEALLQTGWSP